MRKLMALAAALCVACGGEPGGPAPVGAAVAGTYVLRTANGRPVPYTMDTFLGAVEVVSGTITLTADGTYTESGVLRITPRGGTPAQQTLQSRGTYRVDAQSLQVTPVEGQTPGTFTVEGGAITRIEPTLGATLVYQR